MNAKRRDSRELVCIALRHHARWVRGLVRIVAGAARGDRAAPLHLGEALHAEITLVDEVARLSRERRLAVLRHVSRGATAAVGHEDLAPALAELRRRMDRRYGGRRWCSLLLALVRQA